MTCEYLREAIQRNAGFDTSRELCMNPAGRLESIRGGSEILMTLITNCLCDLKVQPYKRGAVAALSIRDGGQGASRSWPERKEISKVQEL